MKVLLLHNYYRIRGGEDTVFELTKRCLEEAGHEVRSFVKRSSELDEASPLTKVRAAAGSLNSRAAAREVVQLARSWRPDVAHAHNLLPLITPSVPYALRRLGVATLLTIHNYRLTCPIGTHFRHGEVCELCMQHSEFECFKHNCRKDRAESALYAVRGAYQRMTRGFERAFDRFIALNEFGRSRVEAAGINPHQVGVLPNPVNVTGEVPELGNRYVAFVGRFSEEKGAALLLEIARRMPETQFRVAGAVLYDIEGAPSNVEFCGILDRAQLHRFYSDASCLLFPTALFECCPMVIQEAKARGLPIVASDMGGIPELVNEQLGFVVPTHDFEDWVQSIRLIRTDDALRASLSAGAVASAHQDSYQKYASRLVREYEQALARRSVESPRAVNDSTQLSQLPQNWCDPTSRSGAPVPSQPEPGTPANPSRP